jgi:hypothetical protein
MESIFQLFYVLGVFGRWPPRFAAGEQYIFLQFFRLTEILVIGCRPAAVLAKEFCVLDQLFVVFSVGSQVTDVLQIAQMVFMPRMRHFYFGHFHFLLSFGTWKHSERFLDNKILITFYISIVINVGCWQ